MTARLADATAPPGDDERRPWQGGATSSRLASHNEPNLDRRQTPPAPPQLWAETKVVDGGRNGYLLLFVRCGCGGLHAHRAPRLFLSGKRRGACGQVYIVHSGVQLAQVVA